MTIPPPDLPVPVLTTVRLTPLLLMLLTAGGSSGRRSGTRAALSGERSSSSGALWADAAASGPTRGRGAGQGPPPQSGLNRGQRGEGGPRRSGWLRGMARAERLCRLPRLLGAAIGDPLPGGERGETLNTEVDTRGVPGGRKRGGLDFADAGSDNLHRPSHAPPTTKYRPLPGRPAPFAIHPLRGYPRLRLGTRLLWPRLGLLPGLGRIDVGAAEAGDGVEGRRLRALRTDLGGPAHGATFRARARRHS
jgi:hypothetical protein